jgi:arylsulfatase A-like enzyme
MVGAHGMIFKLNYCGYEELFRVPAIIYLPSITKPGSHIDAMVSNIDFLPTLLEAANIPLPVGIDGKSMMPIINGRTNMHRCMVFSDNMGQSIICRDKRYKLVLNWSKNELTELYDVKTDPGELKNLAYDPQYDSLTHKMEEQIVNWLRETKYPYADVIALMPVPRSNKQ